MCELLHSAVNFEDLEKSNPISPAFKWLKTHERRQIDIAQKETICELLFATVKFDLLVTLKGMPVSFRNLCPIFR